MKIKWEELLDFLMCGLETFSRRDCWLILSGLKPLPGGYRRDELLRRLTREKLIEQRGRGVNARFTITPLARQRLARPTPAQQWAARWDGRWRVFSYDLPGRRRKDRFLLWQALRARKLGLLKRSMWVWPHDVEPILTEIVTAHGIPECFCGLEAARLFLCDDAEVVASVWDFAEIQRSQQRYFDESWSLDKARDLSQLAQLARRERQMYHYAFAFDPCCRGCCIPRATVVLRLKNGIWNFGPRWPTGSATWPWVNNLANNLNDR